MEAGNRITAEGSELLEEGLAPVPEYYDPAPVESAVPVRESSLAVESSRSYGKSAKPVESYGTSLISTLNCSTASSKQPKYISHMREAKGRLHTPKELPVKQTKSFGVKTIGTDEDAIEEYHRHKMYSIHGYSVGESLGAGAFGSVHMVKKKKNGHLYASKEVVIESDNSTDDSKDGIHALEQELVLLCLATHSCVVGYFGHFFFPDKENPAKLVILMEYMGGGSVHTQLSNFGPFSDILVRRYTKHILRGLAFLHRQSPPIIHRDIKPANLLMNIEGEVKLADFGSAKLLNIQQGNTEITGTGTYMAPEVFRGSPECPDRDIWSFGLTVLEMCTADSPWRGFEMVNIMQAYNIICVLRSLPSPPKNRPQVVVDFIFDCLKKDPTQRPTAAQLTTHDFFNKKNYTTGKVDPSDEFQKSSTLSLTSTDDKFNSTKSSIFTTINTLGTNTSLLQSRRTKGKSTIPNDTKGRIRKKKKDPRVE